MATDEQNGTLTPVTMKDIARRLGVHISTVHRALSGAAKVSPETIARVQAVAKEMGYNPEHSQAARRLRYWHTDKRVPNHVVALIFPGITFRETNYYSALMHGIFDELSSEGYEILSMYARDVRERPLSHSIVRGDVDGVILMETLNSPLAINAQLRAEPNFADRPIISLFYPMQDASAVLADEEGGAYAGAAHLLDLGHRHLLHFYVDANSIFRGRSAGINRAYRERGLDPQQYVHVFAPNNDYLPDMQQVIASSLEQALDQYPETTAIFALNDGSVPYMVDVLRQRGRRIPEDMSIIGFDDVDVVVTDAYRNNLLTTIHVPLGDMGYEAGRLMLRLLTPGEPPVRQITVPTHLVVRRTTAPPR